MARSFLWLYQRALAAFQAIFKANPPAPPQMRLAAQSQISSLQGKIGAMQQALQNIQANSGK